MIRQGASRNTSECDRKNNALTEWDRDASLRSDGGNMTYQRWLQISFLQIQKYVTRLVAALYRSIPPGNTLQILSSFPADTEHGVERRKFLVAYKRQSCKA